MRQPWFCEGCRASGTCTIRRDSGIFHGLTTTKKAHARKSLFCDRIHGDSKVRVRNPEMMTMVQWRVFVKLAHDRRREQR